MNDSQVIDPRAYKDRIVDDSKQGGKTGNNDHTVLDKETLYVLQDGTD